VSVTDRAEPDVDIGAWESKLSDVVKGVAKLKGLGAAPAPAPAASKPLLNGPTLGAAAAPAPAPTPVLSKPVTADDGAKTAKKVRNCFCSSRFFS